MHHLVLVGLQDSGPSCGAAGMEGAGVDWAMILDGHAASSLMIERDGGGMIVRGTLFIVCPA